MPIIDDKAVQNAAQMAEIDMMDILENHRLQTMIFRVAADIYTEMYRDQGQDIYHLVQIIEGVKQFIQSDKIDVSDDRLSDPRRKQLLILLRLDKVVKHILTDIQKQHVCSYHPVYDPHRRIGSTADMTPWKTGKPCEIGDKTHISHVIYDSKWEASEAYLLDKHPFVAAFVKNDKHLGFHIYYQYQGAVRKYLPDYLVRLEDGSHLILEVKGQVDDIAKAKRKALQRWVRCVNGTGQFGLWREDMATEHRTIKDILHKIQQEGRVRQTAGWVMVIGGASPKCKVCARAITGRAGLMNELWNAVSQCKITG